METMSSAQADSTPVPVQHWPLLFAYRDRLYGSGYLMEISVRGRALCVKYDDGQVWMYGVNPGGIAEHGGNLEAAHMAFRRAFTAALIDIANDVSSFDEFKSAVQSFVYEANNAVEAEWQEAVRAVRAGKIRPEDVGLITAQAERKVTVDVIQRRDDFRPTDNVLEQEPALAA